MLYLERKHRILDPKICCSLCYVQADNLIYQTCVTFELCGTNITVQSSFFEICNNWVTASVSWCARVDGWPVVILANDPQVYGGGWTADAAQKIIRILELAETFHLPVVHLVDNPGFLVGTFNPKTGEIKGEVLSGAQPYNVFKKTLDKYLSRQQNL